MPPGLNKTKNNDYINNPKNSCIKTPRSFGEFLYNNIKLWTPDQIVSNKLTVLDIGCAEGNLSWKFSEDGRFNIYGVDVDDYSKEFNGEFFQKDFLEGYDEKFCNLKPDLIFCNPTWNNPKKLYGKVYLPELFLKKIFILYGTDVPIVFLTSYTLIMNVRCTTKKAMLGGITRQSWLRDCEAKITSILEMPLDFFPDVKMWWHTLFFNFQGLDPVWFLPQEYLVEYYRELQEQ